MGGGGGVSERKTWDGSESIQYTMCRTRMLCVQHNLAKIGGGFWRGGNGGVCVWGGGGGVGWLAKTS